MTTYAVAEDVPRSASYYLTAGKRYPVESPGSQGFTTRGDQGDNIFCLWTGCSHLAGGNWQRVEDDATAEPSDLAARIEALPDFPDAACDLRAILRDMLALIEDSE